MIHGDRYTGETFPAGENARGFRLCLSAAARTVIGNGLDLLGIRRTEEI